VTESVTPSDGDRDVTVPRYKRGFSGNKKGFAFVHVVDACLTLRHTVRRDGSGSVSSQLVAKVGVVDQRGGATEQSVILVWTVFTVSVGVVSQGELPESGHSAAFPLRGCIALMQAQDADGETTVSRCEDAGEQIVQTRARDAGV
jgi:hypothetical protein